MIFFSIFAVIYVKCPISGGILENLIPNKLCTHYVFNYLSYSLFHYSLFRITNVVLKSKPVIFWLELT